MASQDVFDSLGLDSVPADFGLAVRSAEEFQGGPSSHDAVAGSKPTSVTVVYETESGEVGVEVAQSNAIAPNPQLAVPHVEDCPRDRLSQQWPGPVWGADRHRGTDGAFGGAIGGEHADLAGPSTYGLGFCNLPAVEHCTQAGGLGVDG